MGRIRDILKTQRENEDMLRRIDKARPAYGLKSIRSGTNTTNFSKRKT